MSRLLRLGILALALLIAAGCTIPGTAKKKESVLPQQVTMEEKNGRATISGFDYIVSASTDGSLVQALKGDKRYLVKLTYGDGILAENILTSPQEITWYTLSKDGNVLYLLEAAADQSSFRVSTVAYPDGKPKEIGVYEGHPMNLHYFAPYLFFGAGDTVYRINMENGKEERLIRALDNEDGILSFSISPDGRKVAFVREGKLYYYDLDKAEEYKVTKDREIPWSIKWSPDSKKFAFFSAPKSKVKEWIDGYAPIARRIGLYDLENGDLTYFKGNPIVAGFVSWSPDGTKLAYGLGEAELLSDSLDFPEGLKLVICDFISGEEKEYGPYPLTGEASWTGKDEIFWPNNNDLMILKIGGQPRDLLKGLSQEAPENLAPAGNNSFVVVKQEKEGNSIYLLRNGSLVPASKGTGTFKYLSSSGSWQILSSPSEDKMKENIIIEKMK